MKKFQKKITIKKGGREHKKINLVCMKVALKCTIIGNKNVLYVLKNSNARFNRRIK